MAELTDIREAVRAKYAAAARQAAVPDTASRRAGCCGSSEITCSPADAAGVFGGTLYDEAIGADVPEAALNASLGCGVPTAVAELLEGETVCDLGSGGGGDVLISARRVGPSGKADGLDMTDEMLELARANAAAAGVDNVEFLKGFLEDMPLENASVDVVISNCVINLSGDKPRVLREAARVLRPGGRFAVSDVIADADMDQATRADMAAWTGCVAGALTEDEFRSALASAGFVAIEIRETHRVHEHAAAAIIRAHTGELIARIGAVAELTPTITDAQLGTRQWLHGARRARRLATFSLAWLCFEGAATTTAGVLAGSTALLGNGLDGAIEGLASVIVVWRFSGSRTLSPLSEHRAQQLVALSFFLLAPYIAFEATRALLIAHHAETTLLGIGLSIATLCICPWLGRAKLRLGEQLASPATAGEGRQNLICAYLAVAVLAGLLANTLLGIWWLDPVVALAIAALAIVEGRRAWRGESCGCGGCAGGL